MAKLIDNPLVERLGYNPRYLAYLEAIRVAKAAAKVTS